uniref:kappa-type opioid receptor-like n=1 Tax=Styela clava TaxID=7725 RepID=UPI0019398A5F|nr:kappa-type opioid receptor-like [Styela clava]
MDGNTSGEIAEAVVRLLTYVIGTVGNLIVIFVILFLGEYKKITHWYVLQLALADLLFLQTVPFWVTQLLHKGWAFGSWFCTVCYAILYFNYFSSILFLMIMAIDRYLAVCHGQKQFVQNLRSNKKCNMITLCTWILCLVLCIPLMLYTRTTGLEPHCRCRLVFPESPVNWCEKFDPRNDVNECLNTTFILRYKPPTCKSAEISTPTITQPIDMGNSSEYDYPEYGDYSGFSGEEIGETENEEQTEFHCKHTSLQPGMTPFVLANFIAFFVVPLVVITICYGLIVFQLRSKMMTSDSHTEEHNSKAKRGIFKSRKSSSISSTGRSQKDKKRITMLCAILVVVFVVCWLPYHSMMLAMIDGFSTPYPNFCNSAFVVFLTLAYANSALNPFMYNFLGSFRKRLKQIRSHERTRSLFSGTRLTKIVVSGKGTSQMSSDELKSRKQRNGSAPHSEDVPLKIKADQTTV